MTNVHHPEGPLIRAVGVHDLTAVRRELERGLSPNAHDVGSGLTAIMLAAGHGQPEILRELIQASGDVLATDKLPGALRQACDGGNLEFVQMLVVAEAFIDARCVSTRHTPW